MSPAVLAQCQYTITATIQGPECGIFGFPPTFGTALSDNGEVVGWYTACTIGTDEAFYWSEETGFVTLDRPPGVFAAMASDISNEGTIVGTYQRNGVGYRGFVYKLETGEWAELPPINPDSGCSDAYGVSPNGEYVVGERSLTDDQVPHNAFIWKDETGFLDLGLIDGASSRALRVNSSGTAAGIVVVGAKSTQGFEWSANGFAILEAPPDAVSVSARAINTVGAIVGGATVPVDGYSSPVGRPALWPAKDTPIVLPVPKGDAGGVAYAISDSGIIVGSAANSASDEHAIIILEEVAIDLNGLINRSVDAMLKRAGDVSNSGQILVRGDFAGEQNVALVLSPIIKSIADLNTDCLVNSDDLALLLESWGACTACAADLDGNGSVGPNDLGKLLANWGADQ